MGYGSWTLIALLVAAAAVAPACGDGTESQPAAPEDDPVLTEQPAAAEPVVVEEPAAAEPAGIDALLAKRVSLDFAGVSPAEIASMIAVVTGAKVVIDPAIEAELENVPVTLKLSDVSGLDALRTLARIIGDKKIDVREDEVWITNN